MQYVPAVEQGKESKGIERLHLITVNVQVQVAHHFVLKKMDNKGTRRDEITGENLFGRARTANNVTPFQDEDIHARTGEVGGAHQSIVSSANDDSVEETLDSFGLAAPGQKDKKRVRNRGTKEP